MTRRLKILIAIVSVVLLLGAGLCGIGVFLQHPAPGQYFATTSFWGAVLIATSVTTFVLLGVVGVLTATFTLLGKAILAWRGRHPAIDSERLGAPSSDRTPPGPSGNDE